MALSRLFIRCLALDQRRKTENRPDMTENIVDWDVKHQNKQTYIGLSLNNHRVGYHKA